MGPIDEGKSPVRRIEEELKLPQPSVKQSSDDVVQIKQHHITERRGLGKEVWGDIDAQEYVNRERDA
ncbi:MAG TPA: hypothetical protein VGN34_16585 [Ktedonobacteraceae bacterium]|jgi:hypothetical protein